MTIKIGGIRMGLFGKKRITNPISKVKLLGMRTAQQTMTFSTANFSIYSFWVVYENGATKTIEVSPENPMDKSGKEKALFDKLMSYANDELSGNSGTQSAVSSADMLDELKKLKELFDSGVLPQEIYEKKHAELLQQLSNNSGPKAVQKNIKILRENKRPRGEGKTVVYIDGEELDASLEGSMSVSLSEGEHTIYFRRAAIKSEKIRITVSKAKEYVINVLPKTFSIDVNIEERTIVS